MTLIPFRTFAYTSWNVHRSVVRIVGLAVFLSVTMVSAVNRTGLGVDTGATTIKLWEGRAPGAVGTSPEDVPSMTIWKASSTGGAARTAVIVVPGGGYVNLAEDYEGWQVAQWWNSLGVTAFVLKYRLSPRYRYPAPLQDLQRAIRVVRSRAAEFGIDPRRVGVMGFSAGGHLCSMAGTHSPPATPAPDAVDRYSARPDFMILAYPVISYTALWDNPKTRQLAISPLPKYETPQKAAAELSSDAAVTTQTPPTFLFATSGDTLVPAEQHAVLFYTALRKAGVDAELHVFEKGPHGVGLSLNDPVLSQWTVVLRNWMQQHGWVSASR